MRTLILGGYGNFGARISRALAATPGFDLLVAGRDAERAQRFAGGLAVAQGSHARGLGLDAGGRDLANALRAQHVQLVIHTAGPFQAQDPGVALACAQAGAHYIDLADGRRFVCDFPAHAGQHFLRAGRFACSGASSVPALSAAVVDELCQGWTRVDVIDTCIAPAQQAPRGLATLRGVLSYCGEPVQVWLDGRWQTRLGWSDPRPVRFARMKPRRAALCDIPDLELFPSRYAVRQRVWFGAALESGLAQRGFAGLAAARGHGLVGNPAAFAVALEQVGQWLDHLGGELGGMVVRVAGADAQGQPRQRAWHIAADHNHGPEIPCMAAILVARRLAQGEALPAGAHVCAGFLGLAEFTPEFARWGMQTDIVEENPPEPLAGQAR